MLKQLENLNPENALIPFKKAIGSNYGKVVNDVKSFLGKFVEKDMIVKQSGWKCSATGKLTSKDGYSIQMPLNHPCSTLVKFGMRLMEVSAAMGDVDIDSAIPKECEHWVNAHAQVPVVKT